MTELLAILGLFISALAVLYAAKKLRTMASQHALEFAWKRKEYALTYSIVRNERLRDARIAIDHAFGAVTATRTPPTMAVINELVEDHGRHPGLRTHIISLLGHWENMALAIDQGVANEYVAFEMVAGTVRNYVEFFEHFIVDRQKVNPRAGRYLIQLNNRWKHCLADSRALEAMRDLAERAHPDSFMDSRLQSQRSIQPMR